MKKLKLKKHTNEQILQVAVNQCLATIMMQQTNKVSNFLTACHEEWNVVKRKVEPVLQGKLAQCPECGGYAIAAPMCEDLEYICPTCGEKIQWKLIEKTGRYTLVKKAV